MPSQRAGEIEREREGEMEEASSGKRIHDESAPDDDETDRIGRAHV